MEHLDQLFANNVPLIDVRAEIEFDKGAFPASVNLPILNDVERKAVGICYKENGPDDAERLGHRLVSDQLRADRVHRWEAFAGDHPQSHLYCFRGGKRSQIAVHWLRERGLEIPRVDGGYKKMRNHLLSRLETLPSHFEFIIVGGRTGSGKTELIQKLTHSLDLEALANHRGSAFGKKTRPQPTQINFENQIAVDLIKCNDHKVSTLLLEDESRTIGRVSLPPTLFAKMQMAPVLLLEDSSAARVQRIYEEYVVGEYEQYLLSGDDEETANRQLEETLLKNLRSISRRLGDRAFASTSHLMEDAFLTLPGEAHKKWISALLETYYDPMYNYQLQKKEHRIVHRGTEEELIQWLHARGVLENL